MHVSHSYHDDEKWSFNHGSTSMSKELSVEINRDCFRKRLLKYTRRAFHMLPELEVPHILDVGCGSGVSTLELAKLSDGKIIGIDINQTLLKNLNRKIDEQGLSHRVKTVHSPLLEMGMPDEEGFDIIWAEGSLRIIGLEKSLKKCRQLLKPNKFLVVHDATKTLSANHRNIRSQGYKLIAYFLLPEDAWWVDYYRPLEIRISKLYAKYQNNSEALKVLDQYQNEVDTVKDNLTEYNSAFYILQESAHTSYSP